jgi:hypothetical protein
MVLCARDWYVDIRIRMSDRTQRRRCSCRAARPYLSLLCVARLQQRKRTSHGPCPINASPVRAAGCGSEQQGRAYARAWRGDGRVQAAQAITTAMDGGTSCVLLSRASVVASVFSCRYSLNMNQMHIKGSSLSSSLCMIKLVAGQE